MRNQQLVRFNYIITIWFYKSSTSHMIRWLNSSIKLCKHVGCILSTYHITENLARTAEVKDKEYVTIAMVVLAMLDLDVSEEKSTQYSHNKCGKICNVVLSMPTSTSQINWLSKDIYVLPKMWCQRNLPQGNRRFMGKYWGKEILTMW